MVVNTVKKASKQRSATWMKQIKKETKTKLGGKDPSNLKTKFPKKGSKLHKELVAMNDRLKQASVPQNSEPSTDPTPNVVGYSKSSKRMKKQKPCC